MTAGQAWRAPDGRFFIEADTADGVTCFFSIDPDPRITLLRLTADGITDFGLSPQSGGIRPETARSTANALAKAANRQGHHGVPVVNLDTSHIITETAWGATCSCGKQFGAPTDSYHQGALNFTLANAYRHADSANRKERDR